MIFKYHAKGNSNNTVYQVWHQENQPKEIVRRAFEMQKLNYILADHRKTGSTEAFKRTGLEELKSGIERLHPRQ